MKLSENNQQQLIAVLCDYVEQEEAVLEVQLSAVENLRHIITFMKTPQTRLKVQNALAGLFAKYGDESTPKDAAFGWRRVGNSLKGFGGDGEKILQQFLARKQVLYEVQEDV